MKRLVPDMKFAPWTQEEVAHLNLWQASPHVHPFTCGFRDEGHTDNGRDVGVLIAEEDGWHCPDCSYRQYWCHDFMLHPIPNPFPFTGTSRA